LRKFDIQLLIEETYPVIMSVPPRGVTGPNFLNLWGYVINNPSGFVELKKRG
jgi:hypothetical protein